MNIIVCIWFFDSKEIHTANVRRNEKSLSEQNHFKRMTLPTKNLLSTRGMTWHHPVNLGQSSQGFNRSFKVQLTWGSPVKVSTNLSKSSVNSGQVSFIFTWGIRMSKVFNNSFITCWKLRSSKIKISQNSSYEARI